MAICYTRFVAIISLAMILVGHCECGRILIYPYGHCLNSHLLNAEKLAGILLRRGHEVDMLVSSAYGGYTHKLPAPEDEPPTTAHPRLLQFPSPDNYTPVCEYDTMDFMMYTSIKKRFDAFIHTSVLYCDSLLSTSALLSSIKQTNYDLFIVEALDPCGRILADFLDVPFAPLMTAGLGHWDGNPRPPSYLPATISPYTTEMSFWQRVANLLMKTAYEMIPVVMGFDVHFETLKAKHGLNKSISLSDTFHRAAIKLVNSDFAVDYPAPIEPDTVLIGGFAVDPSPPPLSQDLEDFLGSSGEDGVILMSFGTLTKRFDLAWTKVFVEAFAQLPQKVIWRYYPDDDGHNPLELLNVSTGNQIKVMKWLPQASLLAHPKVRLFITHCGLNSMFETTHYGVPTIAIPLSGDQMQHAAKLTDHLGMGLTVDAFSITTETLYNTIHKVLNSPQYRINAKIVSARILDQPMTSSSKAAYWVDYAIRHRGAPHLKSRAHKLTWFQYYSLDVIACIMAGAVMLISGMTALFVKSLLFVWRRVLAILSTSVKVKLY